MNRRCFIGACLLSLAAPVAIAANTLPSTGLSAEQIVDKAVAARGGLAAWRAVKTMTLSGELDAGGKKDAKLPFVTTLKRPHMNRFELSFENQTAVQVYDGKQGWKLRPFLGRNEAEPYTPAEIKLAAAAADLDGPLIDHASAGTSVALVGTEAVEGKSAYKLKLTFKDGTERHLWVDATSFVELKIEGDPRKMDGKLRKVATYYRDYKNVQGLNVPHLMETVVEGVNQHSKIYVKSVAINVPVADSAFAKPQMVAAVQPEGARR